MSNSVAKKIFAVGLAGATVLMGLASLTAHAAVHAAGTNVSSSDGTVWMITSTGQRSPYTSAGAFLSYGFNSFASVVPASAEDLALPQGSFIPPQDGSIICSDRGSDQGTCYLISSGMKYGFTSAAVFTGLGFSFSNALMGDVSFLSAGSSLINSSTMPHMAGTLINKSGTVYLVAQGGLWGIPDLATFNSWGYSFSKVVPANSADMSMAQIGILSMRIAGQLSPSGTTSTTGSSTGTVTSGNVSVSLASDNPSSGTLVSDRVNGTGVFAQVGADLAHFMFNGTGTVTQVVIDRLGVSSDNSVNNVYLYQGNTRITSAGSFSNGMVTFSNTSGLFNVNGSTEISVRVDVSSAATAGQTMGAQLVSYTVANGTPMTASLSGNLFTVASVSDLATVTVPNSTSVISSGANGTVAGTINAGTQNAILWQAPITVGQRAVLLKHIAFTQIGSIQSGAINNIQLYVDGNPVGTSATIQSLNGQNQVVFDFSNPVNLTTGTHTVALEGNIVGGTSFTYDFTLQTAADAIFTDTSYNVNTPLTYNGGAMFLQLGPGLTTINSGTLSVQTDPTFTATQFVSNSSQVTLGQWVLSAYGEAVQVNQLQISLTYTGTPTTSLEGFNNLTLYVNGGGVGSSQSAIYGNGTGTCASNVCTYSFGTSNLFTVPAGSPVTLAVKGDSVLGSPTNVTAVRSALIVPANALQGKTSFTLSPGTQQTYTSTTLTTGTSAATLAKNAGYANQTVGSNQNNVEIGSYNIQSGSIEGVRLNQLVVGLSGSINPTTTLTSLYATVSTTNGSATTTSFTSTPVNPQGSNTITLNNVTIPTNQTAVVNIYANVSNATGSVTTTLSGTGQGLTSNSSVTLSTATGQTVTVGNGSLTSIAFSSNSLSSQFVAGGTTVPVATYNFYATSTAGVNITELGFTVPASGAITSINVNGQPGTVVGTRALVTGLNLSVPFGNTPVSVPVSVTFSKAGTNGVSDQTVVLNLSHVKYVSGSNTVSNSSSAYNTNAGTNDANGIVGTAGINANTMYLVGSNPVLAVANTNIAGLGINQQHLIDVTVGSNPANTNIQANTIAFSVTSSGINGGTLSNEFITVSPNTTAITGSACTISSTTTPQSITGGATVTCTLPTNYLIPSTGITFSLYGTVGGSFSGGSGTASITTQLAPASTFSWTDITGDGTVFTGSNNTTYLANYPTQTWYIHN